MALHPHSIIYCDGACSGNPGPGGWATVVMDTDGHVRELGGGNPRTTNNQMELQAAIEGLQALAGRPGETIVLTDSVYVIRGITQWIWGWQRNGWKTAAGQEVSNREFWQALAQAVTKKKADGAIHWRYVRGHTGVTGNERCDEIAVAFSKGQRPTLFDGPALAYFFEIEVLPVDQGLPERSGEKGSSSSKKAAHSYLSYTGGTAMRHKTWAECERRVKGQAGAKFKKATSAADESVILKSWGLSPGVLKD